MTTFKNTSDLEMWLRIARSFPVGVLEEHSAPLPPGPRKLLRALSPASPRPGAVLPIMDLGARQGCGRAWRRRRRSSAYEAHRANDALMRAMSHYILGERSHRGAYDR